MAELVVDQTLASVAALLTKGWSGADVKVSSGQLKFTQDSTSVTEPANVLRTVVSQFNKGLLGSSPAQITVVDDLLVQYAHHLNGQAAPLAKLNEQLTANTFLAGHNVTVADLAWFPVIISHLASKAEERSAFPNLVRWCDFLSAQPATRAAWSGCPALPVAHYNGVFSIVVEDKPVAKKPAAPAPAPAPAAAAAEAKKEEKAAPKKDAKPEAAPAKEKAAAAEPKKGGEKPAAAAAADKGKGKEKEKKAATPAAAAAAAPASAAAGSVIGKLDVRVGRVVSAKRHPTEDKLYVEEIDVAGEKPLTVVSGLAEFIPLEELKDKILLVLVNVKAGDLKGVNSEGRVLVATSADGKTKELVQVPAGAKIGEQIAFPGVETKPDYPINGKHLHKIWKDLKTGEDKTVQFEGIVFTSSTGAAFAPTVANGTVA